MSPKFHRRKNAGIMTLDVCAPLARQAYILLTYPLTADNSWGPQGETDMTRTNLFLSNRSQVVRLAKDVAFPESVREVTIVRQGSKRVISPAGESWDDFFDRTGVDLGERDQPAQQERESF